MANRTTDLAEIVIGTYGSEYGHSEAEARQWVSSLIDQWLPRGHVQMRGIVRDYKLVNGQIVAICQVVGSEQ